MKILRPVGQNSKHLESKPKANYENLHGNFSILVNPGMTHLVSLKMNISGDVQDLNFLGQFTHLRHSSATMRQSYLIICNST